MGHDLRRSFRIGFPKLSIARFVGQKGRNDVLDLLSHHFGDGGGGKKNTIRIVHLEHRLAQKSRQLQNATPQSIADDNTARKRAFLDTTKAGTAKS